MSADDTDPARMLSAILGRLDALERVEAALAMPGVPARPQATKNPLAEG